MALEDVMHRFLRGYVASPQWIKTAVGRVYAGLPLRWRRGAAYARFKALLEATGEAQVRAQSRARLAETLRWALETVPAYRAFRALLKDLDHPEEVLRALPPCSKADLKGNIEHYLSSRMPRSARLPTFTGGSTAEPMRFYLEKHVTRSREYAFMEDFEARVGLVSGRDLVLSLRGRTVPTAQKAGGPLTMYEPIKHQLILSSDHLESRYLPEYLAALRHWRPVYIQAFPSALYPLARWLKDHPEPAITTRFRGVLLYSENVFDFQMRLFREVFDCPVLAHYGHSERVLMAASAPDDDRYFFWPQYGYVELLDERGAPVTEPGVVGEITGTGFDNRVMPFIRYRTGDLAVFSEKPHPQLPGYPAVQRIEGRLQEFLVTRDRRLISITTMGAAHFEELAAVRAIQYEQREPGRFVLKVATDAPLTDATRERITRAVAEKTQGGCVAEVVSVAEIPRTARGKHVMLIQHLDLGAHLGASSEDRA
ncbi:MAG: phenylacetate--CoA ligase family protein [Acidiferrobacteraceae bacterium]